MTSTSPPTVHVVDGVEVQLPMVVERATGGLVVCTGDSDAIEASLPDDLAPVRLPGGRGIVLLLAVRYLDSPLGEYDELVVGLVARPLSARGRVGAWIEHMAVDQPFTRQAGEQIWGYPKTLDQLDFSREDRRAAMTWRRDGQELLHLELPSRGLLPAPQLPVTTYTRMGEHTMQTELRTRVSGVGVSVRGARVRLGDHPVADQLRGLGLDRRPIAAVWLDRMRMEFNPASPLDEDGS